MHRSLPPAQQLASKISIKKGISIVNPGDIRLNRIQASSVEPRNKTNSSGSPPISMAHYKFVNAKRRGMGGQAEGPYAQNLKKPKLYEVRGTQKIAMKNHLASLQ